MREFHLLLSNRSHFQARKDSRESCRILKLSLYTLICVTNETKSNKGFAKPSAPKAARADELKLRLKRLLVTDRRLVRGKPQASAPAGIMPSYSDEAPGSGTEVMSWDMKRRTVGRAYDARTRHAAQLTWSTSCAEFAPT